MGRAFKAVFLSLVVMLSGCMSSKDFRVKSDRFDAKINFVQEQQIDCLARNIYFEARGEPERGQEAVGLVTMNRAFGINRFPKTVCEVVYDRSRRGCQFSWTCDRLSDVIQDKESFSEASQIAREVFLNTPLDFTDGAEYYHANYVRPYWARVYQRTAVIGNHIFYKST